MFGEQLFAGVGFEVGEPLARSVSIRSPSLNCANLNN
jgi:hypothetical protein